MDKENEFTFEEIFKQNEKRIYYHMLKLGIRDPHQEYYSEGLYAMWMAYKKYEPTKGPLATYFNFIIRNHLIDKIRKDSRTIRNHEMIIQEEKIQLENGNRYGLSKLPVVNPTGVDVVDEMFWKEVQKKLTEKQWKWVRYYIVEGMSVREIAEQENISEEAVKSWGKQARKKLRNELEKMN